MRTVGWTVPLTVLAVAALPPPAPAVEIDLSGLGAFRVARPGDLAARRDGGPSRLRFGSEPDGDREIFREPSELALEATVRAGGGVSLFVHAQYQPEDDQAVDIVRGFVLYEPALSSPIRVSLKGGAFFPGVSRENRGVGWSNDYTITNSAAIAWIGEDVRPVGATVAVRHATDRFAIGAEAGLFFANDASGESLALGGFSLTDIKTPLNGRIEYFNPLVPGGADSVDPFRELDNRPGFQVGVDLAVHDIGAVNVLYWDNRADLGESRPGAGLWDTRFIAASGEAILPGSITILPVVMAGWTENAAGIGTEFLAGSVLLGRDLGPVRLGLRGDLFRQDDIRTGAAFSLDEEGGALTVAASGFIGRHHQILGEIVHVRSDRDSFPGGTGQDLRETLAQVEYRFIF